MMLCHTPDVSFQIFFHVCFFAREMIHHLPILHLHRANFIGAFAASNLFAPVVPLGLLLARIVTRLQSCRQERQGCCFVLPLAAFRIASDENAARPVLHLDGGFCLIPFLSSGTRTATRCDFAVRFPDGKTSTRSIGKYGDSYRAGMDFIFPLIRRNSLPAVSARFTAEQFPCFFARDLQDDQTVPFVNNRNVKESSADMPWRIRQPVHERVTLRRLRLHRLEFQPSSSRQSPFDDENRTQEFYHMFARNAA